MTFPRFSTYVVMIHQRHRQTDKQTTRDLKTIVLRAVKTRKVVEVEEVSHTRLPSTHSGINLTATLSLEIYVNEHHSHLQSADL